MVLRCWLVWWFDGSFVVLFVSCLELVVCLISVNVAGCVLVAYFAGGVGCYWLVFWVGFGGA